MNILQVKKYYLLIKKLNLLFSSGKAFEKQIKTIKYQGEKQVKATQNQGQIKTIESNKGAGNESRKFCDELSHERMSGIKDLSRQIDLNNSTYYFKSKSIIPINFIGFKVHCIFIEIYLIVI